MRYYGIHSNKSRGQISLIPAPPNRRACDMRPLWRDLILKVWPARHSPAWQPNEIPLGDGRTLVLDDT